MLVERPGSLPMAAVRAVADHRAGVPGMVPDYGAVATAVALGVSGGVLGVLVSLRYLFPSLWWRMLGYRKTLDEGTSVR